jgi:predicted GNAT superfamily acetyltransferase
VSTKDVTIAPLQTIEQYQTCERLQQIIWRSDPVEVIPAHLLITAQRHGGLVLGGFDATGEMVGCLFGFAGRLAPDNPAAAGGALWQHCSHFMGVVREWRGRGVGYRLKLAQREWALSQGFQLVTWTYDPLEAANGVLNLGKLGAVCRCYLRNLYGEIADRLNAGLPSDRFEVAWRVGDARVRERVEQGWQRLRLDVLLREGVGVLNPGRLRADGWLEPGETRGPEGERLLVEIPARVQALKTADLGLALAWRLSVRAACETAFAAGYTACDVVRAEADGLSRIYYVMSS